MAGVSIKIEGDFNYDIDKWVEESMQEVLMRAKGRTPIRTGRLHDSLALVKDDEQYSIVSDTEYASFVEDGTIYMAGVFMIRNSIDELPQILEKHRSALKK